MYGRHFCAMSFPIWFPVNLDARTLMLGGGGDRCVETNNNDSRGF